MTQPDVSMAITLLCAVAAGACGWRLHENKLAGEYPFLLAYFLAQSFILAGAVLVGTSSGAYAYIYFGAELSVLLLCSLVVRTLYGKVFEGYGGIRMYALRCVYAAVVLAVAGAVTSRLATKEALATKHSMILGMEFAANSLTFGLAILMVLLFIVLSLFPIKMSQTVLIHGVFLGLLLLIDASAGVINHLYGLRHTAAINELVTVLDFGCYGLWASLMRPEKGSGVQLRPPADKDRERRLLAQLEGLNTVLARAGKTPRD